MPGMRVLSIQSHVVHGYVGNRAATFPLQLLGAEVDVINSVQFSNHTGYKNGFKGKVVNGDDLWELIEGLEMNGFLSQYTHLLTGYIGSESFLRTIMRVVDKMKEHNPDLVYVCDPVLGDHGTLYVPESLIPIYIKEVFPKADIITPNTFEVERLLDIRLHGLAPAHQVCDHFHALGIRHVVLTSLEFTLPDQLIFFVSERREGEDGDHRYSISFPPIAGKFTGTGDLTAALYLAWSHQTSVQQAAEKCVATLQAVLQRTVDTKSGELCLISSKRDIEEPKVVYHAKRVEIP